MRHSSQRQTNPFLAKKEIRIRFGQAVAMLCLWIQGGSVSATGPTFETDIKPLVAKYCVECHRGKKPKGEVDFGKFATVQDAEAEPDVWESAVELLGNNEMPPEDATKQPTDEEREIVAAWYEDRLVRSVQARPGDFRPRRLSATEYRNTLRSLFGFDLEVGIIEAEQTVAEKSLVLKLLPLDPPGKSGFRNDTSGNPLTTVVWDQYAYLSDAALERLFSKGGRPYLEAFTGPVEKDGLTSGQARKLLQVFLPRVYRRSRSIPRFTDAVEAVDASTDLVATLKVEMKAALMSPGFIYRGLLMPRTTGAQQPVDDFELAERLSYFVWADMPDAELMRLAENNRLSDPSILNSQIDRMLASPKARNLAEDFAVQWLSLDQIATRSKNLPQQVALQSQPIDFMHYLFTSDRPLIELIDSKVAFANPFTRGFYPGDSQQMTRYSKPKGIEVEIVPNQKIILEHTPERGGILTIPGVLEMNKGPVLRGTWILERILGDQLPTPPANVGQVPDNKRGQTLTFRERFELHRSKPSCSVCHHKIDPLGFGLQGYDARGAYRLGGKAAQTRKRKKKKGGTLSAAELQKIDTSGQLPSGETFANFQELKQLLVTTQREKVVRNIVRRMLSYALCRKLETYDRPTVDKIVTNLSKTNGSYRDLIHEIANSLPFRQTVIGGKKS